MARSFLLVTVGIGTAIGLGVMLAVGIAAGEPIARLTGAIVACLFVGVVFDTLREK